MPHCCVVICTNDARFKEKYLEKTGKVLHFHKFPKDVKLKKQWIVAIRGDESKNFTVSECSSSRWLALPSIIGLQLSICSSELKLRECVLFSDLAC